MFRLKANKTSLYKLVCYYEPMPKPRRTTFAKARRTPGYWLEWINSWGLQCKAFFSVCKGKPLLSVTKFDCGEEVSRKTFDLDVADLLERGMVEEVGPAARRGGSAWVLTQEASKKGKTGHGAV